MADSPAQLIDALGGATKVAAYLGDLFGERIPATTVSAWKARGSIDDRYRPGLIQMAGEFSIPGITYESLTLMHANKAKSEPERVAS